jgi:hypothetical protein
MASPIRVAFQSFSLHPSDSDQNARKPETKEQELAREAHDRQLLLTSIADRGDLVAHLRSKEPIDEAARIAAASLIERVESLERENKEFRENETKLSKKLAAATSKGVSAVQDAKKLREENAKLKTNISQSSTETSARPVSAPASASKKRRGPSPLASESPPAKKSQAPSRDSLDEPPLITVEQQTSTFIHPDRRQQVPNTVAPQRRVDAPSNYCLIIYGVQIPVRTPTEEVKRSIIKQLTNANLILHEDQDSTVPVWVGLIPRGVVDGPVRWKLEFTSADAASLVLRRWSHTPSVRRLFTIRPYAPSRSEVQDPEQQQRLAQNTRESMDSMPLRRIVPRDIEVSAQDGERTSRLQPRNLFGVSAGPTRNMQTDTETQLSANPMSLQPLQRSFGPTALESLGIGVQQQWMSPQMQMNQLMQQWSMQQNPFTSLQNLAASMQQAQSLSLQQPLGSYQQLPQSYGSYPPTAMQHHSPSGPMQPQHGSYSPSTEQLFDRFGNPVQRRL